MQRVNILGVRMTAEPVDQILAAIREILESRLRGAKYVCATSVHGVIEAQSDPSLKGILNDAFVNHADGMPLATVGRWLGAEKIRRLGGPDLFTLVCEMTQGMNVRHFFYGGAEGVAEALSKEMQARYPGLAVAGSYFPPFRPLTDAEKIEVASIINDSEADIVWVGLSTPKQESWIGEFHHRLNVKLLFSVGAAFDFETGRVKSPPVWIQDWGLEWLFRLICEPRRLWRRYLKIVPAFLALSTLQLLRINSYD